MPSSALGNGGTLTTGVSLATGSGQVIAGQAGKRIRVFAFMLSNTLATRLTFRSNTTDISGAKTFPDKGGMVCPGNPGGLAWYVTAVGEALNVNSSVSTEVGVDVIYDVVEQGPGSGP